MKPLLSLLLVLLSVAAAAQSKLRMPVSGLPASGTIRTYLDALNRIPGVQVNYSSGAIQPDKQVQLSGKEQTVADVLTAVLRGQPVRFEESDGRIFLVPVSTIRKKYTLSGYVTDRSTGERLIGANIYLSSHGLGTTTNVYGFYSFTLEEGPVDLQVTYSGYTAASIREELVSTHELHIPISPSVTIAPPVVVSSERSGPHNRTSGKNEVPAKMFKALPAMMGESDVLKTLQILPGVQAGNEGSSGVIVRGGSPDQNLILLDGVPVYNSAHAFGFLSVFNADAVHHVDVIKSGFPASYGGRLSSVIDVRLKEGDKYRFRGEVSIGLIVSKLTLEGPIKKGRSSFMISGRRTYADLIIKSLLSGSENNSTVNPFFSDLNAKANFPLGEKDHLYFSIYSGKDNFTGTDNYNTNGDTAYAKTRYRYGFDWGNVTMLGRWNHEFRGRAFANTSLTYSRYRFNTRERNESTPATVAPARVADQRYFSGIEDLSIKEDVDFHPGPAHALKFGASLTHHTYRPGINRYIIQDSALKLDLRVDNYSRSSGELDLYGEDEIRLNERMRLNTGLRLSAFLVQNRFFFVPQPRIAWLYRFRDRWSMKASAGQMAQFIHLLTNASLGLPTDLWLPVTRQVPPQTSWQGAAGLFHQPDSTLDLSVELYYKSLRNVIDYREGTGFSNAFVGWEELVERGRGKSYGLEFMAQKHKGALTGILSYTLSRSLRRFPTINGGREFPYKYDRIHELKTALVWRPKKTFEMSASWFFSTGTALSLPVAYYYGPTWYQMIDIYEGRNNFRMPDYHRLDLSVSFIRQKKRHTKAWVFSVFNAYNRFNPLFRYKAQVNQTFRFREVSVFPIMPSFSYQFKF